jgi:hypothetical protein
MAIKRRICCFSLLENSEGAQVATMEIYVLVDRMQGCVKILDCVLGL